MSELSYLEKLLDGVEVEWRNLGDTSLFEIANNGRKPVKASLRIAGETPYYGANNIQDYVDGYTHDGEYVLIAEDGSASLENYSIQYATGKFWANNHVHVVRGKERVHSRFLYHYLCIVNFLPFLTGGGRAKLTKGQLIEIPVPIPCPDNPEKSLAIQSEIVRILDTFTALTAELTAELTMRKKQYNYYRDQLLSFDEGEVEWKTLGEITRKIASGRNKTRQAEGDFPVYGSTGLLGFTNEPAYSGDLLLVARVGAYAGLVNAVSGHFDVSDNTLIIHPSDSWNSRFAFHQLTHMNLNQYAVGAGQPLITGGMLKNLKVPVPSLNEQTRIAKILDKFETITVSITEGLPREIELRQKQYEYYRDLLFSFPKPEIASY
ncbi:restriction endonuclease subunit S (plasmid) [Klebsiella pneumoniae]|uniref:restriction endonuclease subunit S n=1 Tax=Klebsiella pneumoniae TaxID=573 RepID=UPI0007CC9573|nr:restriction endonuclease subunit S [Klebsiella pneumoniae]QLT42176.1 restriction endonuclease subunit S [Klebsiella pneumoniae]TYE04853.1 restriction endonuclease subunit S [Klebsiella pneumoniae]TYE11777.1 restriction endonuclease subunit S [Klebsiella pneumoniae]SAV94893.1 Restriction modification system DNA specificity domain protein [Klebsiella pneumoniae]